MSAQQELPEHFSEVLSAYLDGETTADEAAWVEGLLRTSPSAQELAADFRRLSAALRAMPAPQAAALDCRAIIATASTQRDERSVSAVSAKTNKSRSFRREWRIAGLASTVTALAGLWMVGQLGGPIGKETSSVVGQSNEFFMAADSPVASGPSSSVLLHDSVGFSRSDQFGEVSGAASNMPMIASASDHQSDAKAALANGVTNFAASDQLAMVNSPSQSPARQLLSRYRVIADVSLQAEKRIHKELKQQIADDGPSIAARSSNVGPSERQKSDEQLTDSMRSAGKKEIGKTLTGRSLPRSPVGPAAGQGSALPSSVGLGKGQADDRILASEPDSASAVAEIDSSQPESPEVENLSALIKARLGDQPASGYQLGEFVPYLQNNDQQVGVMVATVVDVAEVAGQLQVLLALNAVVPQDIPGQQFSSQQPKPQTASASQTDRRSVYLNTEQQGLVSNGRMSVLYFEAPQQQVVEVFNEAQRLQLLETVALAPPIEAEVLEEFPAFRDRAEAPALASVPSNGLISEPVLVENLGRLVAVLDDQARPCQWQNGKMLAEESAGADGMERQSVNGLLAKSKDVAFAGSAGGRFAPSAESPDSGARGTAANGPAARKPQVAKPSIEQPLDFAARGDADGNSLELSRPKTDLADLENRAELGTGIAQHDESTVKEQAEKTNREEVEELLVMNRNRDLAVGYGSQTRMDFDLPSPGQPVEGQQNDLLANGDQLRQFSYTANGMGNGALGVGLPTGLVVGLPTGQMIPKETQHRFTQAPVNRLFEKNSARGEAQQRPVRVLLVLQSASPPMAGPAPVAAPAPAMESSPSADETPVP